MGNGSFPEAKLPGRGIDHPPPSSGKVKERVELYVFSPSGTSWTALAWSSPSFYFFFLSIFLFFSTFSKLVLILSSHVSSCLPIPTYSFSFRSPFIFLLDFYNIWTAQTSVYDLKAATNNKVMSTVFGFYEILHIFHIVGRKLNERQLICTPVQNFNYAFCHFPGHCHWYETNAPCRE